MRSTFAVILASATLALSQTTHNINVGAGGALAFDPPTVAAVKGDTIQFTFLAKNHTATQSAFASPCSKLIGADGVTPSGFDSDFQFINATGGTPSVKTFLVQDATPLWFYCRQKTPASHCAAGMVFAVNPPAEGNTFDKFLAAAKASGASASVSGSSSVASASVTQSMVTSTTAAAASTTAGAYSTPPAVAPPVTVTQTVTVAGGNVYTTTYGSYPGSPAPTPNAAPKVIEVTVGGTAAGLVYSPANVTAQPNDIIQFKFLSKNHTVTQSGFSNPCVALASTAEKPTFNSGFMPASDDAPVFWNLTVNDTAPIWAYCAQTAHCGKGMVFSVNSLETTANTFDAFRALAIHINGTTTPSSTNGTSASGSVSGSGAAPTSTNKAGGAGRNEVVLAGTGLGLVGAFFALML